MNLGMKIQTDSPPMIQSVFQDAAWCRATTLVERIASRRGRVLFYQNDEGQAERRMLRWRSQPPFTNASVFAQRLAIDGLTEDEFSSVLGEPVESIRARLPGLSLWLAELSQAFSDGLSATALPFPEGISEQLVGLLKPLEPLIAHSLARLHKSLGQVLRARPKAPVDSETIERILFADLPRQLLAIVSRTLVLELNVARLEGLLVGDTPEDRYRSFLERLRQPEIVLAIMHEYPVLARQLTTRLNQWVAFSLEFVERLCADWDLIRTTFTPDKDPGFLMHVQIAGDRHCRGRSVLIAKFSSGSRLVYKPKSMAVEKHFQELLTWTNQHGNHPAFRTLKILDRISYGWAEFVAAETCDSLPALRRFYERQGAFLALLYVLEATDFHCENVIAAGEHPVLIDLEAIFHPRPTVSQAEEEVDSAKIAHSVLRVGLLPGRDWSNADSEGIDLSGLGGAAGQMTPIGVPDWEEAGTDVMRFTRKRISIPGAQNRPSLNGTEVALSDYVGEIATGFASTYRLLLKHRKDLLSRDGLLARFADDEVRAVLRTTRTYAMLLNESFHPDVLREALDRDLLFDRLWVAVESRPYLAKVIFAERDDLQRGDIPFFRARPGSRDLWTSSNTRIQSFFDEPALVAVQRRLLQLSDRDLDLQLWMIRASVATTAPGHAEGGRRAAYKVNPSQGPVDHDQLLRAARTVGDRLESVAIRWNQNASWFGLTLADERHWSISTLAEDLYDGLPGITLFLAYLGAISGERRYKQLAQEACATTLRRSQKNKSVVTSIGAFDGWGGTIYTLTHLGALWHEPELIIKAEAIVELLPTWIKQDEKFDIIGGAAGCIGSLIALYHHGPSQRTLSAAIECGEHLVAHAERTEHGVGWTISKQSMPLSGFAHGAAGIAWALLKLAALTGSARFQTTALGAVAYERSLFSPEAGNWRDLRVMATSDSPMKGNGKLFNIAWCNGAPGIGLARLSTLRQLADAEARREIEIAIDTTLNRGLGHNHSLCHGDLGNLELLLQAGLVLNDERAHVEAYRHVSNIVESVVNDEFLCGTPSSVESPGLMTGLAGIGYGLLRLAEPARVPSVLMLEPPPPCDQPDNVANLRPTQ
jgi:class II lanthipeptide synthase